LEFRPPPTISDADVSGALSNHPIGDADAVGEPNDVGGWDRGRRTWPLL